MSPLIATILCTLGILGLFIFDWDRKTRTSKALWISVVWMILAVSASKWLQSGPRSAADQIEGNPIQRNVFALLLAIGIIVLLQRSQKLLAMLQMNGPILLFFTYCAASIFWSDFPEVAFKRWIKALGDLVMVLIILTDPEPLAALKRFLARTGFLLVPVSILLIKYYPALGMAYKSADGRRVFEGVTNDKNMLGVICLLIGLGAVWRILHLLRDRQYRQSLKPLFAQGLLLAMVLWLFLYANSMTSLACFALASALMLASSFPSVARRGAMMHAMVIAILTVASLALIPDLGGSLVKDLGRDPTLTGRTELWSEIVVMNGNPLFGTGFESFWMGPRLEKIWSKHWWHPNEAHNGYLEVYLNLGLTGLALLAIVLLSGYRNAFSGFRRDPIVGRLKVSFFVVGVMYSLTEAGFRLLNPVWISFMLGAIAMPKSLTPATPDVGEFRADRLKPDVSPQNHELIRPGKTERHKPVASTLGHQ